MDNATNTPAPNTDVNQVTEHHTSYLAMKTEVVAPKVKKIELQEWHIETVHIAIFFLLTIGLFIGMWKRPNKR